jgi:hypothetical protein
MHAFSSCGVWKFGIENFDEIIALDQLPSLLSSRYMVSARGVSFGNAGKPYMSPPNRVLLRYACVVSWSLKTGQMAWLWI